MPELQDAAIIRELHVFGDQIPVGYQPIKKPILNNGNDHISGQHLGFGKKMIKKAEEIIQSKYTNVKYMAVIS
jgi:elongator complex protein 3